MATHVKAPWEDPFALLPARKLVTCGPQPAAPTPLIGPAEAPVGARPAPVLPYMYDFGVAPVVPGSLSKNPIVAPPAFEAKPGKYTGGSDYTVPAAAPGTTGRINGTLTTGDGVAGTLDNVVTAKPKDGTTVTDTSTIGAEYKEGVVTVNQGAAQQVKQPDGSTQTSGVTEAFGFGKDQFIYNNIQSDNRVEDNLSATATNTNNFTLDGQNKTLTLSNEKKHETEFQAIEDEDNNKSTQTDKTAVTIGPQAAGANTSHYAQGPGDVGKTGWEAGTMYNAADGTMMFSGGFLQNGSGANVALELDENGAQKVAVGGTYQAGDNTLTAEVEVTDSTTALKAGAENGDYKINAGFTDTHDQYKSDVAQNGTQARVTTTLTNEQAVQASAAVPIVSAAASVQGGTTWTVAGNVDTTTGKGFTDTDGKGVDTDQLKKDQPGLATTLETQQTLAQTLHTDGLQGIKLDALASQGLKEGSTVEFTSYNGWSASGGMQYGVVAANMGGGKASANQVALTINKDETMTVSVTRQDNVSGTVGATVFGVGGQVNTSGSESHQTEFKVDLALYNAKNPDGTPANPDLVDAVDLFTKTGVMPGAGNINTPAAQAAYAQLNTAVASVDTMNATIKTLEGKAVLTPAEQKQLDDLKVNVDCAQVKIAANRNLLNDQWVSEFGPEVPLGADGQKRSELPTGVEFTRTTDTTSQTQGATVTAPLVGSHSAGGMSQSWVESAFKGGTNQWEFAKQYSQQYFNIGGSVNSKYAGGVSTDGSGPVFTMYSEDNITPDQHGIIKGMQNRDISDGALDKYGDVTGRMMIAFDDQQMAVMAAELNDMQDPQSVELWQQMGTSAAGCLTNDPTVVGEIFARDEEDPARKALDALDPNGDTMTQVAEAEKLFSTVTSPAEFQKLTPDQQSLYVTLVESSSGYMFDTDESKGESNTFRALAPILLMPEEQRLHELSQLQETANKPENHYNDNAAYDMMDFLQTQMSDDPVAMAQLQPGMAFDWKQDRVEELAKLPPEELNKQFTDAYNSTTFRPFEGGNVHDPDEDKALDSLLAVNESRGPAAVAATVAQSGIDPVVLLNSFPPDKAVERQMYIDMMMTTPYAAAIQAALDPTAGA